MADEIILNIFKWLPKGSLSRLVFTFDQKETRQLNKQITLSVRMSKYVGMLLKFKPKTSTVEG